MMALSTVFSNLLPKIKTTLNSLHVTKCILHSTYSYCTLYFFLLTEESNMLNVLLSYFAQITFFIL